MCYFTSKVQKNIFLFFLPDFYFLIKPNLVAKKATLF